ncbi:MAG: hypothetical protein GY761_02330 [Hyphomicrobiales bacterium]|nr:hypothetical protein [Hyphomicrobiales bacterium]
MVKQSLLKSMNDEPDQKKRRFKPGTLQLAGLGCLMLYLFIPLLMGTISLLLALIIGWFGG